MLVIVKVTLSSIAILWLTFGLDVQSMGGRSSDLVPTANHEPLSEMENAVLHFRITAEGFRAFTDVAMYRKSSRLDVLPGFPLDPNLDRTAAELGRDGGTVERLGRGGLSARDYVLTGWAVIVARDPEDWGLASGGLTPEMRQNAAFVRAHAEGVDALLLDG